MEDTLEQKTAYNLFQKDRIYRDKTLSSIYFKSSKKQVEKKSCPYDRNGIRYKLDLETGEISNYTKKEVLNSMNCSLRRTKILMNMLLEMNDFDWFLTLTFDKQKIDRTDDLQVFNAYKKYINNLSHQVPTFGYMTFPERHKDEDNCIHFHLLVNGITYKQLGLENSGKVCCSWAYLKKKIASREFFERTKQGHELTDTDGLPVYNITTFPYGFSTATRIASRERCNSYVKKYVEKALGSTEIFKKRFYYSKNLKVPDIVEQLIGADFETPHCVAEMPLVENNPLLQNAEFKNYDEEHNVLQFWVDNEIKDYISKGLIPTQVDDLPF